MSTWLLRWFPWPTYPSFPPSPKTLQHSHKAWWNLWASWWSSWSHSDFSYEECSFLHDHRAPCVLTSLISPVELSFWDMGRRLPLLYISNASVGNIVSAQKTFASWLINRTWDFTCHLLENVWWVSSIHVSPTTWQKRFISDFTCQRISLRMLLRIQIK